ncbi:hypothetical protein W97_02970 [Coniosporium apollinis CBS 100218]|uniref:Fumarylacetoacetase-like C-terminal domain-containing protein n=1 Tax=Coniosporium apollinis (strain CBS 100218) TaxID=1168221 RepID=R7YPC0_CONA1|nr:uncharacterized protein W97_02970 [Coniosporium apollinis CBS 100218]EON63742.1 hypothetical protein W97_02970 [Coniosporium apollinis CBS 100218]
MGFTNYISFLDPATGSPRIGHYEESQDSIQPLSFASGTPISNLYQVIEAGEENIVAVSQPLAFSSTNILPPITGRDILAVGKNYSEHAKEFNSSGYDSSDKFDIPTHPVIFTKRATSIIANGEEIYPHPEFTKSLDYEGEIGVIVGKAGFRISEQDALNHVWGYTIINDMTARERQRDHKQFYIGKSADTFCPMGPIAVPFKHLPKVLRVQTHVNGELKQNATTEDLIFSIPHLITTLSEGQTLQPGDVLATGTPAGVGIGKKPPVFLKPGDEITVSVTGLGCLRNKIASPSSTNYTVERVESESSVPVTNLSKSPGGSGLATINGKNLHYESLGCAGSAPIVFVHGLGGTLEYWKPLITALSLAETHSLHLFDLEGHGLSPTSALSTLSISSFAEDVKGVFQHAGISSGATLVAHSMGCLIAMYFVLANPGLVEKLVLVGPPPSPLPEAASKGSYARAEIARTEGMAAVVDAVLSTGVSDHTKKCNPVGVAAVRLSLLGQDPEGYAKACAALAGATDTLDYDSISAETIVITGDEDQVSPRKLCEKYAESVSKTRDLVVLRNVAHWHVFEDLAGVAGALEKFL